MFYLATVDRRLMEQGKVHLVPWLEGPWCADRATAEYEAKCLACIGVAMTPVFATAECVAQDMAEQHDGYRRCVEQYAPKATESDVAVFLAVQTDALIATHWHHKLIREVCTATE